VLLAKSDQLSQSEGALTLRAAQAQLAGRASVQLFSALKGKGLEDARNVLKHWCQAAGHQARETTGGGIKGPGGIATGAD
jgi:GTP-binding protein EngB required for normal cell division